jgi:hypothetical protein
MPLFCGVAVLMFLAVRTAVKSDSNRYRVS